MSASGPSWLGIGAQRSGTTWFTDLLTQHPQVGLGTNGKKEQHLLHKVADGVLPAAEYLVAVPGRTASAGASGRRSTSATPRPRPPRPGWCPTAPVLVLLRDPVERFRSAMRLAATRARGGQPDAVALPGADHDADVHRLLRRPARRVGRGRRARAAGGDGLRAGPPRPRAVRRGRVAADGARAGAAGRGRRGVGLEQPGRLGLARGAAGVAAGAVPPAAGPAGVRVGAGRQRLDG